ncbi:DNA cytosine methyltransferase [Elizabethkingia anophelis]|uniref:DNA cytosine methyltransferase n=1 Tax=Elizabethkingia anophelis TaxID=1117645 RepID=UPI00346223E6|nr:DNA cytosine methyltransferase [Elizabethkingia anophelis]
MTKLKHIELFAGCGGMSLGLKTAGFGLYFANEISPMASETFAYNFFKEDLNEIAEKKQKPHKTLWIDSDYDNDRLNLRLKENPFIGKKLYSDLSEATDLENKLLVGNIDKLLSYMIKNRKYKKYRDLNIDLISGGPPCQSFSLAGKREKNNEKNLLPLSFAKFAGLVQPKVVLLENVKGITIPFVENNEKYHAWLEVAKAFSLEGFVPLCMMVNSKYFGIPQSRPRFILLAYRKDIFEKLLREVDDSVKREILMLSQTFFNKVHALKDTIDLVTINDLKYYDIESQPELFDGIIFPEKKTDLGSFISVEDAIGNLIKNRVNDNNQYEISLNKIFGSKQSNSIDNFELRSHNSITRARFRLYQVLENCSFEIKKNVINLMSNKDIAITEDSILNALKQYKFIIPSLESKDEIERNIKDFNDFKNLLSLIKTKKRSQKALNGKLPAPAQLTIPDDVCHYDFSSPRVLTVREMARIQSFPDWFVFKAKTTTGGELRKYEVPQYTQVGNAVPPLLAFSLGNLIKKQLCDIY